MKCIDSTPKVTALPGRLARKEHNNKKPNARRIKGQPRHLVEEPSIEFVEGPSKSDPRRRLTKDNSSIIFLGHSPIKPEPGTNRALKPEPSVIVVDTPTPSPKPIRTQEVGLPGFVTGDWSNVFLPTLYHALFCSENPFESFQKSNMLIATIQHVLDTVYPGNTYVVTWDSPVCQMVWIFSYFVTN